MFRGQNAGRKSFAAVRGRLVLRTISQAIVSVGLLYNCCGRKAMVGAYQSIGGNTTNLCLLIAERQYTAFTQTHRRLQPRLDEAATAKQCQSSQGIQHHREFFHQASSP